MRRRGLVRTEALRRLGPDRYKEIVTNLRHLYAKMLASPADGYHGDRFATASNTARHTHKLSDEELQAIYRIVEQEHARHYGRRPGVLMSEYTPSDQMGYYINDFYDKNPHDAALERDELHRHHGRRGRRE